MYYINVMKIKLSDYAKQNSLSYKTVYSYWKKGMLNGVQLETGTILIELEEEKERNHNVILYARVSSSENKSNLDSQMKRLKDYANAKGYTIHKEIKEIGSGLNDKRKKLQSILESDNWSKIVVEHKDRLSRFGLNYIEILLSKLNKEIEIINETDNDDYDLMQDFISIITSFCARLYGLRRSKRKTEKIIKELNEND